MLPVTIIGGYLGSGKTTLVNHLLHHANGARLAIMVNDFGDLAIDAELIQGQQGDVISLSGGCVCCSYGDDLSLSLQKLKEQSIQPDHLFIEASGVAMPGAIGRTLSLHRTYHLEGIVVVADAINVMANAQEKYIGDTIERQLHDADLVILNKMDLTAPEHALQLTQWIQKKCAGAPIIEAVQCAVEPAVLFSIPTENVNTSSASHIHHDVSIYASMVVNIEQSMNVRALAVCLADEQYRLIRAKGFVLDADNVMKTIQVVGRRWTLSDAPPHAKAGLICIAKTDDLREGDIRALCQQSHAVLS